LLEGVGRKFWGLKRREEFFPGKSKSLMFGEKEGGMKRRVK
jgi:hypothetical protein